MSLKFFLKMHETDHHHLIPRALIHNPGNIKKYGHLSISKAHRWNLSGFFDNVWKVVFCLFVLFFLLIWHAARTYGRRRGNINVSHFWMYQFYGENWADPVCHLCGEGVKGSAWVWPIWNLCCSWSCRHSNWGDLKSLIIWI